VEAAVWDKNEGPFRLWLQQALYFSERLRRIMTTPIDRLRWSDAEKKIARRVFDQALQQELAEVVRKVKEMARDIKEPSDLWKIEEYLTKRRKAIDTDYDYRYSQLPLVFGLLVRKGRIRVEDLQGLDEEKLAFVRFMTKDR
jgi:hypothetical protein